MLLVFADLLLPVVFRQKNTIPVRDKPLPFPCGSCMFWRDVVPWCRLSHCVRVWHLWETSPGAFMVGF